MFIVANSMIKQLNGWKMFNKLNANYKVFVKTF